MQEIELALLLNDIIDKILKLTVMLNSCHFDSILHDEDSAVRDISWSVNIDFKFSLHVSMLSQSLTFREKIFQDAVTIFHWLLHSQNYTLLLICDSHKLAKKIILKDKQQNKKVLLHLIYKTFIFCAQNKKQNIIYELIYWHVCVSMFEIVEQHFIFIDIEKIILLSAEVTCLDACSIFKIIKISIKQKIWLNADHIHEICIENEYEIYNYAETKELVTCTIIIDIKTVHSVVKHTFIMKSKMNDFQINVKYCAILTKLT